MKKYVWTETRVTGGKRFSGKLPQPSSKTGSFQQVEMPKTSMLGQSTGQLPTFYQDAAVIAYRLPKSNKFFAKLDPKVVSSGGTFNLKELTDGDVAAARYLPPQAVGEKLGN